jgi:large subunit ribosomal protein L18
MKRAVKKTTLRNRRIARVRANVQGTTERPRLTVRRSLAHIYAQIIDDVTGKTLVAASDKDVQGKDMKKIDVAQAVGKTLAERAKAKKIEQVVFDRRDKKYHGRVKALAEGAREGGLVF